MERRVIWRNGPARRGQKLHCEVTHEGSFIGQEDLFEMQDCAPCWRGEGDLRKPEAQAAARMNTKLEVRKSKLGACNVTSAKAGGHGVMDTCPSAGAGPASRGNDLSGDFRVSNFAFRLSSFEER
jgi:hypothetical protein